MSFPKLLLYIGLAILGFWLLGLIFKLAVVVMDIALVVGLVLVIVGLINEYIEKRKAAKSQDNQQPKL